MAYDRVITFRPDTVANWTLYDPVLSLGEGGFETDTIKWKIGDGSTVWSGLPYEATTSDVVTNTTNIADNVIAIDTKPTGVEAQLCKAWGNFNGTGTPAWS